MSQNREMKHVTLVLPGYTYTGDENIVPEHLCHAAFRFMPDAERQPWQSQLAEVFGIDTSGGMRLPSARLACHARDYDPAIHGPEIGIVRADPVSLKPDKDTAKLVPAQMLGLSEAEADELLLALNEFVAEDGLHFFRHGAGEWYLSGMAAEALESYPPSFLADRNASAFLPDGDAAAPWRRLLTEIQMLLHMQPVNALREQSALLPINSVWFWGGAPLPAVDDDTPNVILFTDDAEARALSSYMNVEVKPLSAFAPEDVSLLQADHIVIMDDSLVSAWLNADAVQLSETLLRLNEQWLLPLTHKVRQSELMQVQILTEDGLQGICDAQSCRASNSLKDGSWWTQLLALVRR